MSTVAEFLQNPFHLILIGLMLSSGTIAGAKAIGTLEATRLMNTAEAAVIDVREANEFAGGRIPKSKNFPLSDLAKRIGELDRFKSKPVVITCASGTRSGSAIRQLKKAGFTEIYALKGGLSAWREAGLPTEK
jgi:rhodanese-related sulfurtransferase